MVLTFSFDYYFFHYMSKILFVHVNLTHECYSDRQPSYRVRFLFTNIMQVRFITVSGKGMFVDLIIDILLDRMLACYKINQSFRHCSRRLRLPSPCSDVSNTTVI
jgi:hypothetical protein